MFSEGIGAVHFSAVHSVQFSTDRIGAMQPLPAQVDRLQGGIHLQHAIPAGLADDRSPSLGIADPINPYFCAS